MVGSYNKSQPFMPETQMPGINLPAGVGSLPDGVNLESQDYKQNVLGADVN